MHHLPHNYTHLVINNCTSTIYRNHTNFFPLLNSNKVNVNVCKLIGLILHLLKLNLDKFWIVIEKPLSLNLHTIYLPFCTVALLGSYVGKQKYAS